MDGYMTTYRQDFIWPYIRTFPISTGDKKLKRTPEKIIAPLEVNKPWIRYGPNPPLLDPRIYPGTLGKSPGQIKHPSGPTDKTSIQATLYSKDRPTDGCACWRGQNQLALSKDYHPEITVSPPESALEQPSELLKQLQEKYPYLYNVLKNVSPDEIIARLMSDRFKSTYMIDFGKEGMHPSDRYDQLMTTTGLCAPKQNTTKLLPGVPYRPKIKNSKMTKIESQSKNKSTKKKNDESLVVNTHRQPSWLPWKSEYQDIINKLGGSIIKEGLYHTRKRKKRKI